MVYKDNFADHLHFKYIKSQTNKNPQVVVLAHGLGLDLTSWGDFIPHFADYDILIYDLRGHGQSNHHSEGKITWELLCADLERLVNQLNIEEFHLIGYGIGGNIGVKFALAHPNFLKSLTLISTTCYFPLEISEKIAEGRKQIVHQLSLECLAVSLAKQIYNVPSESKINQLVNILSKVSISTYFELADLVIHTVSLDELAYLSTPTLVLTGEYDQIYSTQLFSITASYLPNSRFLIAPNASNAVYSDQPELVATWIKDFLLKSVMDKKYNTSLLEQRAHIIEMIAKGKTINAPVNRLKVSLMGPFRVEINGQEVMEGWGQRNAKRILAFLAYHRTATREQLYDILWPEVDIKKAQNNLRVSLNYLKKLINQPVDSNHSELLQVERELISLQGELSCDVHELVKLIKKTEKEQNNDFKALLYKDILKKIPCTPFPGFYDQWILDLRDNFEENMVSIAKWLADYYKSKNENIEAMKYKKLAKKLSLVDEHTDRISNE